MLAYVFKFISPVNFTPGMLIGIMILAKPPPPSSGRPSLLAGDPYSWAPRLWMLPHSRRSQGGSLGLQFSIHCFSQPFVCSSVLFAHGLGEALEFMSLGRSGEGGPSMEKSTTMLDENLPMWLLWGHPLFCR